MQQAKISTTVCENCDFLRSLVRTKSGKKINKLLKTANDRQLLSLAEICLNIVKCRFTLTARQQRRMLPYADFIRRMSRARSEQGARKIVQKGSGVGVFAAILTPILLELARNLIKGDPQPNQ